MARLLEDRQANLEARTGKGNTALLLTSGAGVSDVVNTLIECKADITASHDRGLGGMQSAHASFSPTRELLEGAGAAYQKKRQLQAVGSGILCRNRGRRAIQCVVAEVDVEVEVINRVVNSDAMALSQFLP